MLSNLKPTSTYIESTMPGNAKKVIYFSQNILILIVAQNKTVVNLFKSINRFVFFSLKCLCIEQSYKIAKMCKTP